MKQRCPGLVRGAARVAEGSQGSKQAWTLARVREGSGFFLGQGALGLLVAEGSLWDAK